MCRCGCSSPSRGCTSFPARPPTACTSRSPACSDRKSTRLNSSHLVISYAVFCLKKNRLQLVCFFHLSLPLSGHICPCFRRCMLSSCTHIPHCSDSFSFSQMQHINSVQ